ncbi:MAG: hypothetical protein BGO67_06545 [Alphaproteobacteria bacterium 41-28]|nr:MAG: hypothetical protein BGO67_06545 [Alphaproteobacteria bacterium 41-28]
MLTNYFKSTISTLALLGTLSNFTSVQAMEENEHSGGKANAPTRGPSVSSLRKKFEQAPTQNSASIAQKPVGAPKSVGTPKPTSSSVTGLKKLGVSPTYPLPQFSTKSSSTPSVVKRAINQNPITPTSVLPITQPSRGLLPTPPSVKRNVSPKTCATLTPVSRPSRGPLPVPPTVKRSVNPITSAPQPSVTRPSGGPSPIPPGIKRSVNSKTTAPLTSVTRPSRGPLPTLPGVKRNASPKTFTPQTSVTQPSRGTLPTPPRKVSTLMRKFGQISAKDLNSIPPKITYAQRIISEEFVLHPLDENHFQLPF